MYKRATDQLTDQPNVTNEREQVRFSLLKHIRNRHGNIAMENIVYAYIAFVKREQTHE